MNERNGIDVSRLVRLPEPIERRVCPTCNYMVAMSEILYSRHDYNCPRCRKHTIDNFIPWDPYEPPKPRKRKRKIA